MDNLDYLEKNKIKVTILAYAGLLILIALLLLLAWFSWSGFVVVAIILSFLISFCSSIGDCPTAWFFAISKGFFFGFTTYLVLYYLLPIFSHAYLADYF